MKITQIFSAVLLFTFCLTVSAQDDAGEDPPYQGPCYMIMSQSDFDPYEFNGADVFTADVGGSGAGQYEGVYHYRFSPCDTCASPGYYTLVGTPPNQCTGGPDQVDYIPDTTMDDSGDQYDMENNDGSVDAGDTSQDGYGGSADGSGDGGGNGGASGMDPSQCDVDPDCRTSQD